MGISRRKFVTDVGLTGAGFAIVPRRVLGKGFTAPSDTLASNFRVKGSESEAPLAGETILSDGPPPDGEPPPPQEAAKRPRRPVDVRCTMRSFDRTPKKYYARRRRWFGISTR